jgi:hypothetical protein
MKLYVFIRRRIAVSAKKDGFKQHCFKQPCLICFLGYLCRRKAALGNLKASFHCARLHFLCRRKAV